MTNSVVMAYILPMIIGQTYDMRKDLPGIQIFNSTTFENTKKIVHYTTDSQYKMVESSKDIKDVLDVQGKLSIKIKQGQINVDGEGSYLRDRSTKSNSIDIIVRVHFETETHSIPTDWQPKQGWNLEDKKYLGTHYCRSITYGGDLIAVIRFLASNRYDKEHIKGAIQGGLNAKGINVDVNGRLEKLKDELHDSSSMEINYYASVPIPGVSYTIEGLMKLVNAFPSHVKKVNNGLGNPLRMELYPLNALSNTFPVYFENKALIDQLEDLEDQLDDLLTTKREIAVWLNDLPPLMSDAASKKISIFLEKLENVYSVFSKAISELDLSVGGTTKPFEDAFKAYKADGTLLADKYFRSFKKLQKEVYEVASDLRPDHGGANYVQWGRSSCSGAKSSTAVTGFMFASPDQETDGSSEYICNPYESNTLLFNENFSEADSSKDKLLLDPVLYRGRLNKFQKNLGRSIPCAVCRVVDKTASLTLNAFADCPNGWTTEYSGIMMSSADSSLSKGRYICIDDAMTSAESISVPSSGKVQEISEVNIKCGSLPCGPYDPKLPIPCVVCTK